MREIILDTETTGLRPSEGHKIIEIAAVEIINFLPTGKSYQQYINPERDVPQSSIDIHGLTQEFLVDKPIFTKIADDFKEFIRDDKIIAHNVDFDIGFINYELQNCGKSLIGNETLDTVSIAREKFPGQSVSLDALCKKFSIDNTQRKKHSATLDTDLLARVYIELVDAREPSLDLEVEKEPKVKNSTFDIKKIKNRTLPNRLTSEEKKLHEEFIKTLGEHSVWKSIRNK
jgi:DNA polymerase-3 subunit epsilon